MLTRIKIEKLFDQFDYDIELKTEGITILTGPNGYGKTTILKILDALASRNVAYFFSLPFDKIVLEFPGRNMVNLEKTIDQEVVITSTGTSPGEIRIHKNEIIDPVHNATLRDTGTFAQTNDDQWFNLVTNNLIYPEDALKRGLLNPMLIPEESLSSVLTQIPNIYLIQEQRLLRPIQAAERRKLFSASRHYPSNEDALDVFSKTIDKYAKELGETIKDTLAKSSQIAQELDSSFPRRLFDQVHGISDVEFTQRFDKVKETQKALSKLGFSDIQEDSHPTYKPENAKALCVYIDDTEQKLAVFAELLQKLNTFTDILNKRRFTFKRIDISKKDGFKFSTNTGTPLNLSDLSSGEQQEVVMLYELLFKVEPGTLVLIDEPEISLHVAWQKQFLDDLFKIVALQKINVIIATHSPQIINNHWDLTVDLEENSRCGNI